MKQILIIVAVIALLSSCKKEKVTIPCGIVGIKPSSIAVANDLSMPYPYGYFSIYDSTNNNVFTDTGSYIVYHDVHYGISDTVWSYGTKRTGKGAWHEAEGWYFGGDIPLPQPYVISYSITMYLKYGLTYTSRSSVGACTSAWDTIHINI